MEWPAGVIEKHCIFIGCTYKLPGANIQNALIRFLLEY